MADRESRPWWDLPVTLLVAVLVILLITTFVAKPFSIPSGSMENTLQIGDRVLVNRVVYHLRPIERGDVVVFDGRDSFTWVDPTTTSNPVAQVAAWVGSSFGFAAAPGTDFVKRVIGVGGDRVACCDVDGRITVNGSPIEESGYIYAGDAPSDQEFDVVVPAGMLWLMGDHRSASADSRAHLGDPGGGMVSEDKVVGRVMNVLWPLSRIASVDSPQTAVPVGSNG